LGVSLSEEERGGLGVYPERLSKESLTQKLIIGQVIK